MHQRGKKGESAAFACPLSKFSQRMKHIKQMITSKDILFFEGLQSKVNPFLFVAYDNFRYWLHNLKKRFEDKAIGEGRFTVGNY